MQIRQIPARWRGRDAALADRSQAHASGPGRDERDGAARITPCPFSHPCSILSTVNGSPPTSRRRWADRLGTRGSAAISQSGLVLMYAGNGDMSDLGRRFADCFTLAAADADWSDNAEFRGAIRAYIDRVVAEVALSHPNDADVAAGLPIPHWPWDGRHSAA